MQVARYGGGGIDTESQVPDEGKIDRFVSYCRQIKVEPWIQVPLFYSLYHAGAIGPDVLAASLVKYSNVDKGYNVKLWSIGNEPDIYRNLTPEYTADAYCRDFRKIAAAMKAVDPYIKIIGPEYSNHYDVDGPAANNWFTPFLRNCGDIVDIVGLHRYPFDGRQTISVSMTDSPTVGPQIDRLRLEIKNVTGRDIPLIFRENNLTWQYVASQMIPEGMGSSLAAGLWWADVLGRFANKNLHMAYLWDLVYDDGLSLFEALTQIPRPTFDSFGLYSHFFNWRLPADTNAAALSVVASRNDDNESVSLVVVNRSSGDLSTAVRISGSSTFTLRTNYIRVQNSWEPLDDRTITFPLYSMTCLQISRDGQTRRRWSYSNDEFTRGVAPTASDW
jgi:hypothetical protein